MQGVFETMLLGLIHDSNQTIDYSFKKYLDYFLTTLFYKASITNNK